LPWFTTTEADAWRHRAGVKQTLPESRAVVAQSLLENLRRDAEP
jgi:hypothetical protein